VDLVSAVSICGLNPAYSLNLPISEHRTKSSKSKTRNDSPLLLLLLFLLFFSFLGEVI
jgi:hypothetical protein